MAAIILDGKKIASEMRNEVAHEVDSLKIKNIFPGLAVVLVGSNPASTLYVGSKRKACEAVGILSKVIEFPENVEDEEILQAIKNLNEDKNIQGILVQLPLPSHLDKNRIIRSIAVEKDVDCFLPENFGEMALGETTADFKPCTAEGIMELLRRYDMEIEGKNCVIIGKSNIVGKPLGLLLLQAGGTVTICHRRTKNLAEHTRMADILVAAAGKAGLVSADMVKPGAVVIDVGINRLADGKIVGDVDFDSVREIASAITPVPGGVGPLTIAQLLKNTLIATKNLKKKKK